MSGIREAELLSMIEPNHSGNYTIYIQTDDGFYAQGAWKAAASFKLIGHTHFVLS